LDLLEPCVYFSAVPTVPPHGRTSEPLRVAVAQENRELQSFGKPEVG
jgi:hypothetical protein